MPRCVVRFGDGTSEAVTKGRLEVATYLVQGVVKERGGDRDRVDLSKVQHVHASGCPALDHFTLA